MTDPSALERIQEILRDLLDEPRLTVDQATNPADLTGWDSLTQIRLVSSIESAFGVRLALWEREGLGTLGAIATLLEEKLRAR